MTPIRRTFLLLLCYAFFLTADGQENFLDGYVVLRSKDTIRGQIDFRDWNSNPYQITFQEARTAKKTSFKADELTAFFVSGETYRSFAVTVYPYSLDVETLSNDFKDTPYDSVAFLRLLLPGKLSLYGYADRQEGHYFFVQRQDERPEQLRIRSSVVDNNGLKALDRVDVYIDQLRSLVYDCPGLSGKTGGLPYTESAIRKLLFSYDHCGKDTVEKRVAHSGETAVRFEPLVGFIHTSFHVTGETDAARMSWPADNSILAGVGAHIFIPRSRQQFSFLVDVLYNRLYSKSSVYKPNDFTTEMGYINLQLLQSDVLFRYQYPAGKVRPFVEAGIANIFVIKDKSYMGEQETGETLTRSSLFSLAIGGNGVPSYIFGLTGGAGVQIGRFSIEARISHANGISEAEDVRAPITSTGVLAGWSF